MEFESSNVVSSGCLLPLVAGLSLSGDRPNVRHCTSCLVVTVKEKQRPKKVEPTWRSKHAGASESLATLIAQGAYPLKEQLLCA